MGNLKKILKAIYAWWMKFARALGFVNTRILLTLIYFVVIGPFSIVFRVIRKDTLRFASDDDPSFWILKKKRELTKEDYKRQF